MKEKVICGIQQVGIGVEDLMTAWKWYNQNFNIEIKIVDDDGVAERMLPYTGGKPQPRHAILAISQRGGGGLKDERSSIPKSLCVLEITESTSAR